MQQEEHLKKLTNRYVQLAIVSLFLMAFLQGLHSFFFTLFFWPSVGFAVLALYYRRAAKQEEQSNTAQWQQRDSSPSSAFKGSGIFMIAISIGVISFIAIFFSSVWSKRNDDASAKEVEKTDEPELQESEKKSSDYELALQEYNNQNYRSSISIGRKAIVNEPENKDVMLVLGDDYGALKQNDSSFIWFDRAYQKGARSAYLSHWLGYLNDDKGNQSVATEFYKDALKQDSSRTQVYDRLAELEPERAAWYKKKSAQWAKSK